MGYLVGEFDPATDKMPEQADDVVVSKITVDWDHKPQVCYFSPGSYVRGFAYPSANGRDLLTKVAGSMRRMCRKQPSIDFDLLAELMAFVARFLKTLPPIDWLADGDFYDWLENSHYNQERKIELTEKFESKGYVLFATNDDLPERERRAHYSRKSLPRLKCFIKRESYDKCKNPRGIYARGDEAKVYFGPFVKQCEKILFAEPFFVKGIPVDEWAGLMVDRLMNLGATYEEGDYSSMESSFVTAILKALDCAFYKHMASTNSHFSTIAKVFCDMLCGDNDCDFGNYIFTVRGRKMSGEMNTSQSNAFATLMLAQFFHFKNGGNFMELPMLVEGDDSLASKIRALVSEASDYAKLGFTYEALLSDNLGKLGFCGVVCVPEDKQNTTDPLKVVLRLGWLDVRYSGARVGKKFALLKMKLLSWAHCYPSCPIVWELCRAGLAQLKHVDERAIVKQQGWWEKEKMSTWKTGGPVFHEPTERTRLLVEEKFGVLRVEQLAIEQYFREEYRVDQPIDDLVLTNALERCKPHLRRISELYVTDLPDHFQGPPQRTYARRVVTNFLLKNGTSLVRNRVLARPEYFGISERCFAKDYI